MDIMDISSHLNFKEDGEEDIISKVEMTDGEILSNKEAEIGDNHNNSKDGDSLNNNKDGDNHNSKAETADGDSLSNKEETTDGEILNSNKEAEMTDGEVLWEILAEDGEINIQESIGSIISSRIKVIK